MSNFVRRCNTIKTHSYAFILGSLVSAFGGYKYLGTQLSHFQNLALTHCLAQDVEGTFYWHDCGKEANPDAQIQASVLQGDDTEEILADMGRKRNGGRRK